MTSIEQVEALDRIQIATRASATAERQLDEAVRHGASAGLTKDHIVAASDLSRSTVYRKLAASHAVTSPTAYRDFAPAIAVDQPADGVTIAFGADPHLPPAATFTFTAQEPILALYERSTLDPSDYTLWPVIAASLTASDARIQVYGPRPTKNWDSPTYFGDEFNQEPGRLATVIHRRLRHAANGTEMHPIVALFDYRTALLTDMLTLIAFGHHAKFYGIVRSAHFNDALALIASTVVLGGVSNHTVAHDGSELLPTIPQRLSTGYLATTEGQTTFSL